MALPCVSKCLSVQANIELANIKLWFRFYEIFMQNLGLEMFDVLIINFTRRIMVYVNVCLL